MAFWRGFAQPVRYAALVAGAVPVLAFPAPNLEFLAWFGLVPGLFLLRAAPTGREAAARGWWFGVGYLLAALYWLTPNLGPALLLVVIVLGAPWAAVGYASWRLLRGRPSHAAAALIVLPSTWVLIDLIRSWQGIGGPWAVYGASQWQHPIVLALGAVGGIWLITFVLVASNTAIVVALTAAHWTGRVLGLAAAALAIAAGPVAYAATAAEYAVPPAGHLTLALVQPGLEAGPHVRLAAESRLTAGIHHADMIVWAESSVGYDLYTHRPVLTRLVRLSAQVATPMLVSQDALNPARAKSKVAVLITPGGIEGTYIKTRLVPFGEYIPFRSLLGWLSSVSRAAPENMISGHGAHVLHAVLPDGRGLTFGVLICFESSFSDMSAADVRQGAQVLIYQTSDSTFQESWALEQHASLAAIRAAESGRPAVQAALTGDSAAFDSRGRLLAWMGASRRGVLRVTLALPLESVRTPFDRYGDYVPWLAIAVVAIGLAWAVNARGMIRRLLDR